MKRYLTLVLVVLLLLPCLIVPASATTLAATAANQQTVISWLNKIYTNTYNINNWVKQLSLDFVDYFDSSNLNGFWATWVANVRTTFSAYFSLLQTKVDSFYNYFTKDTELFVYWDRDGDGTKEQDYVTEFEDDMIALYVYCRDVLYADTITWFKDAFTSASDYLASIKSHFVDADQIEYYIYQVGFAQDIVNDRYSSEVSNYKRTFPAWMGGLASAYSKLTYNTAYAAKYIFDFVHGNKYFPDQFEEDKAPLETEMDSMIDSMETAPTINLDDIETEVDKVTEFETDANYISVLSSIFLNEAFTVMFAWCIILAMLGYILYGKR